MIMWETNDVRVQKSIVYACVVIAMMCVSDDDAESMDTTRENMKLEQEEDEESGMYVWILVIISKYNYMFDVEEMLYCFNNDYR